MLESLLDYNSFGFYNIELARILGVDISIYLSVLISINNKAIKKEKLDADGFFCLDRKFVESRTTYDNKIQIQMDSALELLEIIRIDSKNKNHIKILPDAISVLLSTPEKVTKGTTKVISKINSVKTSEAKKSIITSPLKDLITATLGELRDAYSEWIDSVYDKFGWISKAAVIEAQKTVDEFAKHDLDKALEVIKISSLNGYRDMTWAIEIYKKTHNATSKVKSTLFTDAVKINTKESY